MIKFSYRIASFLLHSFLLIGIVRPFSCTIIRVVIIHVVAGPVPHLVIIIIVIGRIMRRRRWWGRIMVMMGR